jgi:hypothetical protein
LRDYFSLFERGAAKVERSAEVAGTLRLGIPSAALGMTEESCAQQLGN